VAVLSRPKERCFGAGLTEECNGLEAEMGQCIIDSLREDLRPLFTTGIPIILFWLDSEESKYSLGHFDASI